MANLFAYLGFGGNCKEAMNYYQKCLGGELKMMTFGESPMGAQTPPEMKNKIMHSVLNSGNIKLMAADMVQEKEFKQGNTIYLCIAGEVKGEIEIFFSKLSVGGRVTQPLKEEFFGTYGSLTDKYGFNWMFQYGQSQNM